MHERPSSFHKKSKLASVTFYNKFASAPPTKPASNTPACPILAGADVSTPEVELLYSKYISSARVVRRRCWDAHREFSCIYTLAALGRPAT